MNLIVTDAADADAGSSAPLSWEFWYSVQKSFFLEALGGVNLVDWPPFFEELTTSASLRAAHTDIRRGEKQEEVAPPSFDGCITSAAMRLKPFLLLADSFTEKELTKILPQVAGRDWVLVSSGERWEMASRCVRTFNRSLVDLSSSLVLFDTIQPGAQICRTPRWWESGNLETKKSGEGVNIWWSEAMRARICDEQPYGSSASYLETTQARLRSLIRGSHPRLAWDFSLGKCRPLSPGYEQFLNEAPLAKYRLATDFIVAATDGSALKVQPEGSALFTKLGCGVKFRDYDLNRQEEGFTLEDASFRGSGGDDSFQAEAGSIYQVLLLTPRDWKLVIAYDAEGLVQDIEKRMRSFGAPSANDPTFRPIVKKILDQLALRVAETIFVKVKSHHGCHLNYDADHLATVGALQEDLVLDKWQLVDEGGLCYKLLGETLEEGSPCLSLRQARLRANKEIARLAILDLQAKPSETGARISARQTLVEQWMLRQGCGRQHLGLVWTMPGGIPRFFAKAITSQLPVTLNLYKWGLVPSPLCPYCTMGVPETFSHFMGTCPGFHLSRTKEAMTFSKGSLSALELELSTLVGEWVVRTECTVATIAREDLKDLVFTEEASGHMEEVTTPSMKNLRPDGWLISHTHRSVFVIEHARMDDTFLEPAAGDQYNDGPPPEELARLKARAIEKIEIYAKLVAAIRGAYPRYKVACLPFVIGAKLTYDEERWSANLAEIIGGSSRRPVPALSTAAQNRIIKRSVLAAARATFNSWQTRLTATKNLPAAASGVGGGIPCWLADCPTRGDMAAGESDADPGPCFLFPEEEVQKQLAFGTIFKDGSINDRCFFSPRPREQNERECPRAHELRETGPPQSRRETGPSHELRETGPSHELREAGPSQE